MTAPTKPRWSFRRRPSARAPARAALTLPLRVATLFAMADKPRRTWRPGAARTAEPCVCANLRMAARAVTQLYDDAMRPAGLRVTQFSILSAAGRLGPTTLTRLGHATRTDRTTLTRTLAPLARPRRSGKAG